MGEEVLETGIKHYNKREYQEALELFCKIAKKYPNRSHAWNNILATYLQLNQPQNALEVFNKKIPENVKRNSPNKILAIMWKNVGLAYVLMAYANMSDPESHRKGCIDKARDAFATVNKLDPTLMRPNQDEILKAARKFFESTKQTPAHPLVLEGVILKEADTDTWQVS